MSSIIRTIHMLITGTPQKLLTGSIAWIILAVIFGFIGLMVPKIGNFFNPCTWALFFMAGLFLAVSLLKYAIVAFNRR